MGDYTQYGRDEVVTLTAKHFEDLIRDNERQAHQIRQLREKLGAVIIVLQGNFDQNHKWIEYGIGSEVAQAIGWKPEEMEVETDDGQ